MKLNVECFNKVKKDCLKFIKSQETKADKFKNKERMIKSFLIPLCFWIESKASKNPGWLWDNVIKFSDLKFFQNYSKIMDETKGIPWTKWCVDGKTNIVLNCIDRMNAHTGFVVALDVPTGIDSDTGFMEENNGTPSAVRASLTISFITLKQGLFTGKARSFSGQKLLGDLGIAKKYFIDRPSKPLLRWNASAAAKFESAIHKYKRGRVLILNSPLKIYDQLFRWNSMAFYLIKQSHLVAYNMEGDPLIRFRYRFL